MGSLRIFLRNHRRLTALLVGLALCMKILVPAGYMVGEQAKALTVLICADGQGAHLTKEITIPVDGKSSGGQSEHGKADGACPYSALSMASLAGADDPLLALALAFILALGFVPAPAKHIGRVLHLRPPLRGPPAFA